ncbi:MAG: hypothetical protein WB809_00835 [Thermoplasmata archaeon]
MASRLRLLSTVGAFLILVGFVVAGLGYLNVGFAESQELSCTSNCQFDQRNATNATLETDTFTGIGFVVGGVGAGCTLVAALVLMGRWPPPPTPGGPPHYPPSPPPTF